MIKNKQTNGANLKRRFMLLAVLFFILLSVAAVILFFPGCDLIRGKSNYEIAVENGFEGTEREWLETLKGEKGDEGQAGESGTVWHTGTAAPENTLGADGDFYLNTDNFELYKKESGEWGLIGSFKNDGKTCNHAFGLPKVIGESEDCKYWIVKESCTVDGCGYYITRPLSKDNTDPSVVFEAESYEALSLMLGAGVECVTIADGANITLGGDIEATGHIEVREGAIATLDLNGHTLSSSCACSFVKNYGTLTIDDGTGEGAIYTTNVDEQGRSSVMNFGALTINGGTFGSSASRGQALSNFGTATVNGGKFTACDNYTNGGFAYAVCNGHAEYPDAVMTINDAEVYGKMNGAIANDGGTLTVKGGTYILGDGVSNNNFYLAYSSAGTLIIEGGTFTRRVLNAYGFFYTDGGTVDLYGGTFTDEVNGDIIIAGSFVTKISAPINGNTFLVKNSRVAVKDGVSVSYSAAQSELHEEYSLFEGYTQYSNDSTSNVYYYWYTESGAVTGVYEKIETVIKNGYIMDGEFIRLVKDVTLTADLSVQLTEGTFTIYKDGFKIEGAGKIVLPVGVSVKCDGECGGIKAADGYTLNVQTVDGVYIYTAE